MTKLCGAKTRSSGKPCRVAAMPNGKCYHHGGASLAGIAAPSFKHGRHSRYLPTRLLERYQEAERDPELLVLRADIALLDARIADVLGRVDKGESSQLWKSVKDTYKVYRKARTAGDVDAEAAAWEELGALIERGHMDYLAWADVLGLLDQRRRFVESERARLKEMQQTMTAEQAMILLAAVADTVRRYVTDRTALAGISSELNRLVAVEARAEPLPTGGHE